MNDFFEHLSNYNTAVLAKPGEGMNLSCPYVASKFLQGRKVNSGSQQQPKHAAPWYRRFDKRQKP